MKPKVKICGITNLADALAASKAGADYLGFIINCPQSPRNVSSDEVCQIVAGVKKEHDNIKFVGVFVDQPPAEVNRIGKECQLDILQFHGQETLEYCWQFKKDYAIWKAVICANESCYKELASYRGEVDKVLLDSGRGSGQPINLDLLRKLDSVDVVAGGVNMDNIKELLMKLDPQVIDINSGVESAPGQKDANKMSKIIKLIKS